MNGLLSITPNFEVYDFMKVHNALQLEYAHSEHGRAVRKAWLERQRGTFAPPERAVKVFSGREEYAVQLERCGREEYYES